MKYQILLEKPAAKFISRLPKNDKERVVRAIERLPFDGDIKQLRGQKSKGFFRLRVGDYRIIYTVDSGRLIVRIVDGGNRGQIYDRY